MHRLKMFFVLITVSAFGMTACGPGQLLGATITPSPSPTDLPTPTATSTSTPLPTFTPTPTTTFTPTPELLLQKPKYYLPSEAELPRGFSVNTSSSSSDSFEILEGIEADTYRLSFENQSNARSWNGEPNLVIYLGFTFPEEHIAQAGFEILCTPEMLGGFFYSNLGDDYLISDFVTLDGNIDDIDESIIYGTTITGLLVAAKSYMACYREKNFIGVTYLNIFTFDQDYSSSQAKYFAELSTDKLK